MEFSTEERRLKAENFTTENCLELLAAMCKDSADCFEQGARKFLDGVKLERKGKSLLKQALTTIDQARLLKDDGLRMLRPEVKFLQGREKVDPIVDGEYVMTRLLLGVVEAFDIELVYDYLDRQRAKKLEAEKLEVEQAMAKISAELATAEAEGESAPKKKRGRPKKIKEDVNE